MKIAIVTGASSGMGEEFALKIDALGMDEIWGVALEEDLLNQTKQQLKTPMRCFAVDLTNGGVQVVADALAQQSPQVCWLVNASGFGKFGRYDQIPTEQATNMIRLNCEALVAMTNACLPYMAQDSRVVQFGSLAAFQPTPYVNVYAATKAFVYSYSRALRVELKSRKIKVTVVCPFWTKTAFFNRAEKQGEKVIVKYTVMYNAQKVVDRAFRDAKKGKARSIYGFVARWQVRLVKALPVSWVMKIWCNQQKFDKRYANKDREVQ